MWAAAYYSGRTYGIETPGIAHYAYLIADGGEAAIVDPRRDIDDYLTAARQLGSRIRYVIETHRQEDFVMGSAHLAERTGAEVANGEHELFGHGDIRLKDGESFSVGKLTVKALHTPGHTPESMCYAVYAPENEQSPWCVFTGDTLFFGTTGRTDLPDAERSVDNAGLLYDSVHNKIAGLGDRALVLPAHGPGSVCGSGMAERPYSTLGDEKGYNEVFTLSREDFA
ncbi:MBL fold metallo-hydrolase [Spongiibacter thalassae]|uniref:MBL fold metallo-hydrolase n=1 Tax=Spongiibacter thalassae TaxID=2721624 RepID=UPI001B2FF939